MKLKDSLESKVLEIIKQRLQEARMLVKEESL